ncbi:hypothetical protein [Methylobacterium sp. J-076]|uniref:hypothetical protein n=1 Tax=Methylobacterium sp. J-076 TaxID=2836655 RepID=UPI001FBC0E67|nr:hypothetical protein [Methylobacterium sp. J-076]MCJ2011255.1 hypothetical protein [Methylobacterium sp. J-076]
MSMDFYVMCDRPLASSQEWQQAIHEIGFDLQIPSGCDVATMEGFIPVTWRGRGTGFECSPFPFAELLETYDEKDFGGSWPFAYAMYAGSLGGCAGALIAAAAIVAVAGGRVYDPQEGLVMTRDEAVRHAATTEAEILKLETGTAH